MKTRNTERHREGALKEAKTFTDTEKQQKIRGSSLPRLSQSLDWGLVPKGIDSDDKQTEAHTQTHPPWLQGTQGQQTSWETA